MKNAFYDLSEKDLQQGAICKFTRSSLLSLRKHYKKCEKKDETSIKKSVEMMSRCRFVVLSQSCDIKNKTGFRRLENLYCLLLHKIDEHCINSLNEFGKKIGADLKKHLKKVKNQDKRGAIQKHIDKLELSKAFELINIVLGKKQSSNFKDKINMYEREKKMFGEMKEKKHNSSYQDCFFFPRCEELGLDQDAIVRFSVPNMIAPKELQVLGRLNHPYSEALAQRFGAYFYRVALPD